MKRKKDLLSGGLILAFFSLLAKAVGALYRLPLTNILGAEGMGAYQMAYPVYALIVAATSSAIPVLVARSLPVLEDVRVQTSFWNATLRYALGVGLIFGALLALLAPLFSALQGSGAAAYGYYALSPAVVAVSLLSALRGWFNARLDTLVTALSGLVEQTVKIVGVLLAYYFASRGVAVALFWALMGVTLSEICACAFLWILYRKKGGRLLRSPVKIPVKAVLWGAFPLAVGGLIFPLATFADSLTTVKLLVFSGLDNAQAVAEYGVLAGSVSVLVNVPVALSLSFAVTALPVLSRKKRERDLVGVKSGQSSAFRAVFAICIPSAVGLAVAAKPLVGLLYGGLRPDEKTLAVLLLRLAAAQIPLAGCLQIASATLQALDKSVTASVNMLVGGVVKLFANFTVLWLGVSGVVFSTLLCYGVCLSLDAYHLLRLTGRPSASGIPSVVLSSLAMGVAVYFVVNKIQSQLVATLLAVLLGGAVYAIMLVVFRAVFLKRKKVTAR